jgi:hypothetical protein
MNKCGFFRKIHAFCNFYQGDSKTALFFFRQQGQPQ